MSWPRSRSRSGILRHEPLELRDELAVATQRELCVGELLGRREAQLLQPPDLDRRERRVGDVGECRPAPQSERLAQLQRGSGRFAGSRLGDESLEPEQVQRVRVDDELVATGPGADALTAELTPKL